LSLYRTSPPPISSLSLHDALPISYDQLTQAGVAGARFTVPLYRAVFDAITAAGGPGAASGDWVAKVAEEAGEMLAGTVTELAVTDRKSTRLNSSHVKISYAVFCLK